MVSLIEQGLDFDDVMIVPKFSDIRSRSDVSLRQKMGPFHMASPLISANMNTVTEADMALAMNELGGLGILHRFNSIQDQVQMMKTVMNGIAEGSNRPVAVSVGVGEEEKLRADRLIRNGASVICIDVAHGHSQMVYDMIKFIRELGASVFIIAGNVATKEGASFLENAGADAIKVGIGPGRNCITRDVTGCGVPQLTAIIEARAGAPKSIIVADGGIRKSGDIAKALVCGADFVMIGGLLAGTDEAPGDLLNEGGVNLKKYKGMASFEALIEKKHAMGESLEVEPYRSEEGIVTLVEYAGSASEVINKLHAGIRSSMTYLGAPDMETYREYVQLVRTK